MKNDLQIILKKIVSNLSDKEVEIKLDPTQNFSNGDFTTNVALRLGGDPMNNAKKIKEEFERELPEPLEKIEVASPGFINFFLSRKYLLQNMNSIDSKYGEGEALSGKKILIEFAHPNTHKEFHIGHLRNISIGESIAKILLSQKASLKRVNYQGDVGLHVAKALYGIKKYESEVINGGSLSLDEKAKLLGKVYSEGSKAYEEDEKAKEEILKINKQIYAHDPEIFPLWEKTRAWSLEYFESIYKRVGAKFDRLYFESEVFESGKKIVEDHIKDGVFQEDSGAVIFDGEKYGLHKRVFITGEGNPTYEAKEMGLAPLEYKEFPSDEIIHIVGPEQAGYFKVVFKAIELVFPEIGKSERHIPYGFVQLKDGKMSSRSGNVVAGTWLLDEAKSRLRKVYPEMNDETLEKVGVGAVKYSMLKFGRTSDISFSFDDSITLEGNSGPYIQYAYVRIQSILAKTKKVNGVDVANFEDEELDVLRYLVQFPEVVEQAADSYSPNLIANYLFNLAQKFNLFYQKHKVVGSGNEEFRTRLITSVGQVLKNGLNLLGVETVEKM